MPVPPAIARFTDEELARTPGLADHAITATIDALSRPPADVPPAERLALARVAVGVAAIRPRMTADYFASLRAQLKMLRQGAADAMRPANPAVRRLSLALVDEQEVASDVEISRVAHEIRTVAEHELRELRAFLATLGGDAHVDQNHVELDAAQHARAFWMAAQLLGAEPTWPVQFLRHGAKPLALTLRRSWAAATTRLEEAGVEPAAYRTLVMPAGQRTTFGGPAIDSQALQALAQSVRRIEQSLQQASISGASPAVDDPAAPGPTTASRPAEPATERDPSTPPTADRPVAAPFDHLPAGNAPIASSPAAQGATTITPILDLLAEDTRVTPDLQPVLKALRQPILQVAAADPSVLNEDEHVVWQFVDRVVWQSTTLPPAPDRERLRTVQVVVGLVDQLCKAPSPGADTFQWALERLIALERNRRERRAKRHAEQARSLAVVEQQLLAPGTGSAGDLAQLPTVPADLFDTLPAALAEIPPADAWLESLSIGSVARLLMRGRWVHAELLWHSPQRELWLWGDCRSDEIWPVRRGALRMLFQGRLAATAGPDTIVREAAHRMAERAARTTLLAQAGA